MDARERSFLAEAQRQGRAVAPTDLARLFPHETERRVSLRSARNAPAALPKEVFWHIAQFWRSDRDPRY
ncbi:hypothetical protein JL722_1937 [Aureococcus anophagefferens]|nr:hypothetical protein JL722_1937 [Aureococcus anophagefferens]